MKKIKDNCSIMLRCATCGSDDHFEFNEDKSYIKCTMCNREYFDGLEELKELNEKSFEDLKEQIADNARSYIQGELRRMFKGNKYIKIK